MYCSIDLKFGSFTGLRINEERHVSSGNAALIANFSSYNIYNS